jgi:hypothetical protein
MTWGSHGTFCTFVDLVDESDFLRFDYEDRFIRPQCIQNLLQPRHSSALHIERVASPLRKPSRHLPREKLLQHIKRLRTLLSTCATNRPVFQD